MTLVPLIPEQYLSYEQGNVPRLIQLDQPEWEMEAEQPVMFKERRGG